jgi:predicted acetyltransferase
LTLDFFRQLQSQSVGQKDLFLEYSRNYLEGVTFKYKDMTLDEILIYCFKNNICSEEEISKFCGLDEEKSFEEYFERNIEKFVLPQIVERVKEYLNELEKA